LDQLTKKDYYHMNLAMQTANFSTCIRLKVGAVLTDMDNMILSTGYNGTPSKIPHCINTNPKKVTPCNCIHAEQNAIIKCMESWRSEKKLYTSTFPCFMCCKLMANFGVKKIFYVEEYRDMQKSKEFLNLCGITYEKI